MWTFDDRDRRRFATGCIVAFGSTGVLTLVKSLLPDLSAHPFALLLLPVILGAAIGGLRAGLVATGLCWLAADFSVDHRIGVLLPSFGLVLVFVIQALAASALFEIFHRERRRLEDALRAPPTGNTECPTLPTLPGAGSTPGNRRGIWIGFAIAVGGASSMTLTTLLFSWPPHPYDLLLVPVVVSAWWGGVGPGLLATLVSALGVSYFGLDPLEPGRLSVFLLEASTASFVLEALRRERWGLRRAADVARKRVRDLSANEERLRRDHSELDLRARSEIAQQRAQTMLAARALESTEDQLRQSQKMEAVGRLAAGVAHDFNNLLTVILSYSTILQGGLSPSDPLRAYLDEISQAGLRAGVLTRQLLSFSRLRTRELANFDLNDVVTGMERMIVLLLGVDVEFGFVESATPSPVKADRGQIEQVLMNLVVNAGDAMPRGGRLTIEVVNIELDVESAEDLGTAPGSQVRLSISDTGSGIAAADLPHIFEPFFTTKEQGRGTGLGLSIVEGIVKQSGGAIAVASEPEKGSTFKLYLPRVGNAHSERAAPGRAVRRSGAEVVLLVEDDQKLRELIRDILRLDGYRVLEAPDGAEALRLSGREPETIQLLLTDVVMPSMSGGQLAERLGKTRPEMRVLFMSGKMPDAGSYANANTAFLAKPLMPETLLEKIREVLDAPPGRFEARQIGELG